MEKGGNFEAAIVVVLGVLLGFVAVIFSRSIFDFFFVPIVIVVLWSYGGRLNELKAKVAELESKQAKEPATEKASS